MSEGIQEEGKCPVTQDDQDVWYHDEEEEAEEAETPLAEYDITAAPNDFNVRTMYDFIESRTLEIPGFQRNYVWDKKRASKLIESLVIGLPVPQIFLYEKARNRFIVIDGQQRLMSIYYFMKMRFPRKEKRTALRRIFGEHGLMPDEILADDAFFEEFELHLPERLPGQPNPLNGRNYDTLGDYKPAFQLRTVRNVIIKKGVSGNNDDSPIHEIFNRLNSGGVNLTPQEVRASLYHSEFYEMLHRINLDDGWRRIFGIADPDLHLRDMEILLRGFAMLIEGQDYKPSMKKFLNVFSKKCQNLSKKMVPYLEALFMSFLESCSDLPAGAFYSTTNKMSVSLFESVFSVVCEQAFESRALVRSKISAEKLTELRKDSQFVAATRSETTSAANVTVRRDRARQILLGG